MIIKKNKFGLLTIFFLSLLLPPIVSAHQPRITENRETIVADPEISKAYYAELTGSPHVYLIKETESFELYVNVLVPNIKGQNKDVSAIILKDGNEIAKLDGINFTWRKFFEPFGHDTYWMGPEYKVRAEAGTYEIRVFSVKNDSKYSLAIGEKEAFDFKEGRNALTIIPKIKRNFFNESPVNFIFSPFGYGLILVIFSLAFTIGLVCRYILRRIGNSSDQMTGKNIGTYDRIMRSVIATILFIWAINTTWSPMILFFSGFALFEAIFSWCGFYVALGKNTC